MAEYFGVSLLYLRGETNDRTRMSTWMEDVPDEPADELPAAVKKAAKKPKEPKPEGGILDGLLATEQVKSLLREIVLETLRSPEGRPPSARRSNDAVRALTSAFWLTSFRPVWL